MSEFEQNHNQNNSTTLAGPESDYEIEISTYFHNENNQAVGKKIRLERIPSQSASDKPKYSLSLKELEEQCPFPNKNCSYFLFNDITNKLEQIENEKVIEDPTKPLKVQVQNLCQMPQMIDVGNLIPHSTSNNNMLTNPFHSQNSMNQPPFMHPQIPQMNRTQIPMSFNSNFGNFNPQHAQQMQSHMPQMHYPQHHNFHYQMPNMNDPNSHQMNNQMMMHTTNQMPNYYQQYPNQLQQAQIPMGQLQQGISRNPSHGGIDSSTSYGGNTDWYDGASCGKSSFSLSSKCSSLSKRKFKQSKDYSVMSNSTNSVMNINNAEAEIQEMQFIIDFTKFSAPPLLEYMNIDSNFFVTKFGNEFARVGLSQLDILMNINDYDLRTMSKQQGEDVIEKMLKEKALVRLTVGRLNNSRELDSVRKYCSNAALDSISTAPISNKANTALGKENINPIMKTDQMEVVSFLTSESSLDDIRHNLTLDTSLFNIVRAMMHPDSKLERKTRTHCSIKYQNSFTGNQLVQWLLAYVKGLHTSKDAKALAQKFMNAKLIKCPLFGTNSRTFSENTLYTFVASMAEHQKYLVEIEEIPEESQGSLVAGSSSKASSSGTSKKESSKSNQQQEQPEGVKRHGSIRRSGRFATMV